MQRESIVLGLWDRLLKHKLEYSMNSNLGSTCIFIEREEVVRDAAIKRGAMSWPQGNGMIPLHLTRATT